jgi:hypothetical protein
VRLCIVTDQAIGPGHGTGTLLAKYFEKFPPQRLLGISPLTSPGANLQWTMLWPNEWSKLRFAIGQLLRFRPFAAWKTWSTLTLHEAAVGRLRQFKPDLLWLVVWSKDGIRAAREIAELCPGVPSYISFWDLIHPDQIEGTGASDDLDYLLNRAVLIDAISEPLAEEIATKTSQPVKVENFFCSDLPGSWRSEHRAPSACLKCVMVGNVWYKDAFDAVAWLLSMVRSSGIRIHDARWLCLEASMERLGLSSDTLPEGITYGGHFSKGLASELAGSDFCLVPIHGIGNGKSGYARYSIPSRVSEVFAAGIPVVAIADPDTAFARFLKRTGAGIAISPSSPTQAMSQLCEFIMSLENRAKMGVAARRYAEQNFEMAGFRRRLAGRLELLARQK